jgi:hypothetical protein
MNSGDIESVDSRALEFTRYEYPFINRIIITPTQTEDESEIFFEVNPTTHRNLILGMLQIVEELLQGNYNDKFKFEINLRDLDYGVVVVITDAPESSLKDFLKKFLDQNSHQRVGKDRYTHIRRPRPGEGNDILPFYEQSQN